MDREVAVRLMIRGRVQGVGFRAWAVSHARRLRLVGWVRNRRDGAVEALAAGREAAVAEFARLCGQGPTSARVTEVNRLEAEQEALADFRELPTL